MAWDDLEAKYYEFLKSKGYIDDQTPDDVFNIYVPFFDAGDRVLDIGCGDGKFMDLLQAQGCEPVGLDIDPGMVALARERGHEVIEDDMHHFLGSVEPETLDGVFSSNVIEHISPTDILEMLAGCHRAMKPGGRVLLATPNPESPIVHLYEFWRDATHDRMYNRQLIEFMMWYSGFEIVESAANPHTTWEPELQGALRSAYDEMALYNQQSQSIATPTDPDVVAGSVEESDPPTSYAEDGPTEQAPNTPTSYAEDWSVEEALAQTAYLPISRKRQLAAQLIYRITPEVDLRLYQLETVLAHHARLTGDQREELAAQVDNLHVALADVRAQARIQARAQTQAQTRARAQAQTQAKALQELKIELDTRAQNLQNLVAHLQSLTETTIHTLQFLFPPREIYVVGRKIEKSES